MTNVPVLVRVLFSNVHGTVLMSTVRVYWYSYSYSEACEGKSHEYLYAHDISISRSCTYCLVRKDPRNPDGTVYFTRRLRIIKYGNVSKRQRK